MKNILLVGIILLCMAGCKKDALLDCKSNTDATKTNIRIKNSSKYTFHDILVNTSGGEAEYGSLKSGEISCYNTFDVAYAYAYIKLYIHEQEFILQPKDYVGEEPLGKGNFTYVIDVIDFDKRSLSASAERD